jgi:alpha-glucosidase (family GH31 glycosyl hydrolase)
VRVAPIAALAALILVGPAHAATLDPAALRPGADELLRGVGALHAKAAGGWFRGRRVLSVRREGSVLRARVATTDPAGRVLAVRVAPDAQGVLSLRVAVEGRPGVEAVRVAFRARAGERYFGFGERSNAVDQRGRTVESYVSDGPYRLQDFPLVSPVIPAPGFRERADATYFPIPWLLSTRGYGVLVDDDETSRFELGAADRGAWSVEVDAPRLDLRVFAGRHPADVLRRFSARLGRQPPPAAPFYFGPWYQPRRGDERAELDLLLRRDVPLSVAQTYTHYLPCGDQRGREAAERERTAGFHAAGLAVTTYFNPMICTDYQPRYAQAVARGALNTNAAGAPYTYRYAGSTVFAVAQFDFIAPAGRRLYRRLLGEATAAGYDGWMEDFGEYTPLDARARDGLTGSALHNRYARDYHCAAYAFARSTARPLVRFQRSGWTGAARCAQVVWGGDPTTDWGFDGLRSAVVQALTMGLSGVGRWGSDIGGYFSLRDAELSEELLIRWIQLGAVSGVMRTEANGVAVPAKPRPQISDPGVLPQWRRWAKLRTQLYPYVAAADAQYRRTGLPIMRQLALAYPDDRRAVAREDEFLFGPDLLAAPVLGPGERSRALYLPRGEWIDLWRSARYDERGGGLDLRRARLLRGGRAVRLPAPLGELPLLARAGALLPLLTPDVGTLAAYGGGRRQLRLADRARRLDVIAFPRGDSAARFGSRGRLHSRELRGRWALTVGDSTTRSFRLRAALSTLRRPLLPCRVSLGGRPLRRSAWRFSAGTEVLEVRFRAREGRLVVEPC